MCFILVSIYTIMTDDPMRFSAGTLYGFDLPAA
jgi:hypothetical protein